MSEVGPKSSDRPLGPWAHGGIYLLFLLLVALYTYPLILNPAVLLPDHHDPRYFGWIMISNAHRLLTAPFALFHGNALYPFGNTLTYSEFLLTPTLTAAPVYYLTGNPVLAYNLTLLLFWALSGWAMFFTAYAFTRSFLPALLAAIAFTLSPYRTDYYLEFQMQLAFPIPLAVLFSSRFFVGQRWQDLALALLMVWIQALASWYYAIILSLALAVFALCFLLLRWDAWQWSFVPKCLVGGIVLGVALAPFAWPYLRTRQELGFERGLDEAVGHSADILTYLETGVTKLYHLSPTGHIAETSLFMGFTGLALGGLSLLWLRQTKDEGPFLSLAARLTTATIGACLVALFLSLPFRDWTRAVGVRLPGPSALFILLVVLAFLRLFLEGWIRHSQKGPGRALGAREWIMLLSVLGIFFFVVSLGPVIHYGHQPMGTGVFAYLHAYLFPLRATRVVTRYGVIVVFAVSLLAAFGLRWLIERCSPRAAWSIATGFILVLLAEYATFPLSYGRLDWGRLPVVYRVLAQDPEDVAVLEWPMDTQNLDAGYMLFSTAHWKRLVNGFGAFIPDLSREISDSLSAAGATVSPERALFYLRAIHPLRYLILHNDLLSIEDQEHWRQLLGLPGFRWLGRYGSKDLYRLELEERGVRHEKLFSYDYLRTRREARFRIRPIGSSGPAKQWLEIEFNGRILSSLDVSEGWSETAVHLTPPFRVADVNRFVLTYRFRRPPATDFRYRIGKTGVNSPVDLHVVSGGKYYGWDSRIFVNGVDYSPRLRGYNLVALSQDGTVVNQAAFDTFASRAESLRLARFIEDLPIGTIIVASVKDEAAGQLTAEAVQALRAVGGKEDLRGRLWVSHLLIGAKGAAPGTAIEDVGARLLTATLGEAPERLGIELRDFAVR